jgi:small-conductance mechanosensitive channel
LHPIVTSWLDRTLLGSPVSAWLWASGVALGTFFVFLLLRRLVVSRLERVAGRTATDLDDFALMLARRTRPLLLFLPSLHIGGAVHLELAPRVATGLKAATLLAVLLQVGFWGSSGLEFWVLRTRRRQQEGGASSLALVGAMGFAGKLALWTVLLLLAFANLGVDVTALIAGLGVGGVAVALSLQNVLGDLFAALSIVLDRPFVIGDTIAIDDLEGTVESIGMKTTRLRSVTGEQLIFSNGDLLKSRVRNLQRMTERRILLSFGVDSGTPVELLERIPEMVREVVEVQAEARFARAHFKGFGPSSFDFEAAYFVSKPDGLRVLDQQQAVNFALLRRFAAEGIEMAVPASKLRIERAKPSAP